LLLVHGAGGASSRWAGITPALADNLTVYALDRRGRGGSGDAAPYSLRREIDDLIAVMDAIDRPPVVLGHSFGGMVAIEAALERRVAGLILYEPPVREDEPLFPPGVIDRLEAILAGEGPEAVLEAFMVTIAGLTADQLAAMKQAPSWPARVAAAHTLARELRASEEHVFVPERFEDLDVPVTLLLGGETVGFARSGTQRLAAVLPHATVTVLAGQGHTAMDTDPTTFIAEVLLATGAAHARRRMIAASP
jgi:pimeloyl-ACP methyl ester carboxylesterase